MLLSSSSSGSFGSSGWSRKGYLTTQCFSWPKEARSVRRAEVASAAERRLVWGESVWIRQVDKKNIRELVVEKGMVVHKEEV